MNQHTNRINRRSTDESIRYMVSVAMFTALAYVFVLVLHIDISFLSFEAKDAIMTVGALCFGPVAGVIMTVLVSLLEYITISGTGVYGLIMNILSSATFVLGASLIYHRRRTLNSAILGLSVSVISMTGVMIVANLFITPFYMGAPRSAVVEMIPTLLLPFNLTKAIMNAGLVLLLYKPITNALAHIRLIRKPTGNTHFGRLNILITVASLLLVAACVLVFLFALEGKFAVT